MIHARACLLAVAGTVSMAVTAPAGPGTITFAREAGEFGRIMAMEAFEGRVHAGTDSGVITRDTHGRWSKAPGSGDLPHRGVLSMAVDRTTGDLWVGTLKGLARLSAGRIDSWNQFSSGLANDIVYGVALEGRFVWAATAAGLSRFDPATGRWWIFNEKNTPMKEIWVYSVAIAPDRVWAGIWGSGVLEYYITEDRWKLYVDPDGESEVAVVKDAGPIHDVTSAVATDGAVVWQATYFGLSRYDGRRWKNYLAQDSGLPSNFIVSIRTHDHRVWTCTDQGLASFDGKVWNRYLDGTPVLSVVLDGESIYAGTNQGVMVGRPEGKGGDEPGGRRD